MYSSNFIFIALSVLLLTSCSSTKYLGFSCQEPNIEIFVDGEYLGRELVYYTVTGRQEYVEVSCLNNGVEVYKRRIRVKRGDATLIELQIPKNYKYSSKLY